MNSTGYNAVVVDRDTKHVDNQQYRSYFTPHHDPHHISDVKIKKLRKKCDLLVNSLLLIMAKVTIRVGINTPGSDTR